ncbi:MAG: hypothetical protein V4463_03350 [Pseudomonadota bacterium]
MKIIVLGALLASAAVHAEPQAAFKPMAFLAGHCWKADMAVPGQTDEHCFSWVYGGQALRDVHVVRTPAKPDYAGETLYFYDSAAKQVQYVYVENMGGISRGTMEAGADALLFPATQYVAGGQAMTYRVRWTPSGDKAYEAFSEIQAREGKWVTQFKVMLKRTD